MRRGHRFYFVGILGLTLALGVVGPWWVIAGESTPAPTATTPPAWRPSRIAIPEESLSVVQSLDLNGPAAPSRPAATPDPQLRSPAARRHAEQKAPAAARSDDQPPQMKLQPGSSRSSASGARTPHGDFRPKWRDGRSSLDQAFGTGAATSSEAPGASTATAPPHESTSPLSMPKLEAPASNRAETRTPATESAAPAPLRQASRPQTRQVTPDTTAADEPPANETPSTSTQPSEVAPVEAAPAEPLKPLTRNEIYLRNKIRRVLSYYYRTKMLNSTEHDPWEIMHSMLAHGLTSQVRQGGSRGKPITAIGWLCYNNPSKRKQLLMLSDEGELRAKYGVGLQGHMGQFLAMLAQCNVDRDYPIIVEEKEFTIQDLIAAEQKTCYPDSELTFKLIGLMHYLPSNSTWVNDRGENWSIERLIEEELKQPIRGAACGGTHRLAGLSLAARKRVLRGEPLDGAFLKAANFTDTYEKYAYRLQNSDGSFSTKWFAGRGAERDTDRRIQTSGHILEWLIYHASDSDLDESRMVRGVNYVTNALYKEGSRDWEIGPMCHAIHALRLYDQRKFQPYDDAAQEASAQASDDQPGRHPSTSSRRTRRR